MRVTEQVIEVEAVIGGLFREVGHDWACWHDERGKRERSRPNLIAMHIPTRRMLAVYVRPRKLHPSEAPDTSWLPTTIEAVVWHPALSADVRRWLANPDGHEPPGVVSTTRDGAK